jgi:hypothetical protein
MAFWDFGIFPLLMDGTCNLKIETSLLLKIVKSQDQEHKPFIFKAPSCRPLIGVVL